MSKRVLVRKIIGLSVLRGLQAGAVLGFMASFCFMLAVGFWAVVIGLLYGCAVGAVLGSVNGLLLACLICRFFFPYTHTQSSALRRVTQAGSVAVSLLVTALITVAVATAAGAAASSVKRVLPIALLLVGAAAWWASWRVCIWYEAIAPSTTEPAGQQDFPEAARTDTQSGAEDQIAPD